MLKKPAAPRKPWPRLSETLSCDRHPSTCQACGKGDGVTLTRWQEHDEDDRPEPVVVVLCPPCAGRLIEPHPRLYRELAKNEPWTGCMPLCVACTHRDGVRCTHPDAKANGGAGVPLRMPQPSVAFWDGRDKAGRRTGGRMTIYPGPVVSCAGRAEAAASRENVGGQGDSHE